ncbi:MAG TPA: hypothetical protein VN782_16665 [Usitatibacter sp.]|nr:hypothetical protein [Usitatibacter sp.]
MATNAWGHSRSRGGTVLLRWWFLAVAQLAGLVALFATGMVRKLWEVDVTKLSIVCLVTLVFVTGFIGWITWKAQEDRGAIDELLPHADACWFLSDVLMGLGMTGTVLGFLVMLNDAFTGNMAAQEVMQRAAPGLATICVTTAVGLVCSMLAKGQLVNLDYLLPR